MASPVPKKECRDAALQTTVALVRACGSDEKGQELLGIICKDLKPAQRTVVENGVAQELGSLGNNAGKSAGRRPAPVHTEDAQATPGRGGPRDEREHEQMKADLMKTKMRSPSFAHSPGHASLERPDLATAGATQAETTMTEDDDEEGLDGPSDTCQFCGLYDANFTDDTLDYHFWQDCPMLTDCKHCGQVIEIPCLTDHLLEECEKKDDFRACPRCDEAIHIDTYQSHVTAEKCNVGKPPERYNRCPLCHDDIPPGEEGWQEHLLSPPGCPANKRRLPPGLNPT